VDAATARRLGIRSMLIVPVLEGEELVGVLEVFATQPGEFVDTDQNLLEIFAREVARIRSAALNLEQRPAGISAVPNLQPFDLGAKYAGERRRAPYEVWSLLLGGLAILLAVAISFLIGTRIGWLGQRSPHPQNSPTPAADAQNHVAAPPIATQPIAASPAKSVPGSDPGGLVVYEQGKVVFRMKPSVPKKPGATATAPAETTPAAIARVWLAPDLAESRLRKRTEPQYPSEAQATHRTGEVVLEVLVGVDGAIVSTRPVNGDPLLASAAADAVRGWHYEPYRIQGRPAEFQTDVTLKFSLPE